MVLQYIQLEVTLGQFTMNVCLAQNDPSANDVFIIWPIRGWRNILCISVKVLQVHLLFFTLYIYLSIFQCDSCGWGIAHHDQLRCFNKESKKKIKSINHYNSVHTWNRLSSVKTIYSLLFLDQYMGLYKRATTTKPFLLNSTTPPLVAS